jgi:hypothetical protein
MATQLDVEAPLDLAPGRKETMTGRRGGRRRRISSSGERRPTDTTT